MQTLFIYTSLLALVISAVSFYWSNIRVANKVEAVFVSALGGERGVPLRDEGDALRFKAILINNGNRREALLQLALGFKLADGTIAGVGSGPAPFTIAAGDIAIFDLERSMADVRAVLAPTHTNWTEFGVQVDIIAKGFVSRRFATLGKIRNGLPHAPGPEHVEVMLEREGVHVNLSAL